MTTLEEDLNEGRLTLTVYNPDAVRSRLAHRLDLAISEGTRLAPVARHWFFHNVHSLTHFYASSGVVQKLKNTQEEILTGLALDPLREIPLGRLFVMVQITGPALLTLWRGQNAVQRMSAKKGATHPADSAPNTIRGSFWCDNGITNLMHCSDSPEDVQRELEALGRSDLLRTEAAVPERLLSESNPIAHAHCSIFVACEIANRMLQAAHAKPPVTLPLPHSGASTDTAQIGFRTLRTISEACPGSATASFINSYLAADVSGALRALRRLPATPWERMVVHAGVLTVGPWLDKLKNGAST